jgi:peptide/nickel transport system substrate-binding protein
MIAAVSRARQRSADQRGFTLIELLVVIIILGIISAVVVFGVRGTGDKGQQAALDTDFRTIQTAQEAYCAKFGHYAPSTEELADKRFLGEASVLHEVRPAAGSCGKGETLDKPSGYRLVCKDERCTRAETTKEVRFTGGVDGYPSPFTYDRGGHYVQMLMIYDTLLWKDATGDPIPWLARELPTVTDGGRTYTFKLRSGVKWHDGMPFAAGDVKFTFDYYKRLVAEKKLPATVIAPPLPTITSVNVIDPLTVEFNLSSPAATFLQFGAAGGVPIAPEHIWKDIDDPRGLQDNTKLVGTGPYRLTNRNGGNYDFTAFDDYFLGAPKVKKLTYRVQGNNLDALRRGVVDQAGLPPGARPSLVQEFQNDPAYQVLEAPPGSSTTQLNFNHAQAPFNDPNFRKAVAYAINRQGLVGTLFSGNGRPGNPGWIPPGTDFHNPAAEQYPFSVDTANTLLDSNGYDARAGDGVRIGPRGQRMEFNLTVAEAGPVPTLLVDALGQIGIKLNVDPVGTALNSRISAGTVGMYLIGSGGLNSDLGVDYLRLVYHTNANLIQRALNYDNPALNPKLDAQLAELDPDARRGIAFEIQEMIADDVPLLPLFYPNTYTASRRAVFDNWYFTPGGVGGVVPTVVNKHILVTGRQAGGLPG